MDTMIGSKTTKSGNKIEVFADATDFYATCDGKRVAEGMLDQISEYVAKKNGVPLDSFVMHGPKGLQLMFLFSEGQPILEAMERIKEERRTARAAALESAIPGFHELQEAYDAVEIYNKNFTRMMESEDNDGVNPPTDPKVNLSSLKAQFPRAAAYITAKSFTYASNHHKSSAGTAAANFLETGGDLSEALEILKNWLPATAFTD